MAATRTIDNAWTQNHQFEAVAFLIFPEQLLLAQFGVGVVIASLGVGFQHCLFVYPRSSTKIRHSVHTERTHQNDAHRFAIRNGIQQGSGSYDGIEEKIRSGSFLSGDEVENQLHAIDGAHGVLAIPEVPHAIIKTNVWVLR